MEIRKPGAANVAPTPQKLGSPPPAADNGPQEQVSVGQSRQDEAIAVIQQMAQERIKLGHQFIGEVINPAPDVFKEVAMATAQGRAEIAVSLAAQAEGTEKPSQYSVETSEYYVLATETKTLAQAALNAEKRAEFQEGQGKQADRDALFQQELGYMIQANAYQGLFAPEQLQGLLQDVKPEGEQALSAGGFVEEMKKHVPAELASQISSSVSANPLISAFNGNPELRTRFSSALKQNQEAAANITAGCLGYFNYLGQIIQNDLAAQQVLIELQQQQGQ